MLVSPRGELDPEALRYSAARKRPVLWLYRNLISRRVIFHSTCAAETEYIKAQFPCARHIVEVANYIEIPEQRERRPGDYFLFVGRVHPKKAIDNLLRGLSLSPTFKDSKFKLKVAGSGNSAYATQLETLAEELGLSDKVQFLGHVEGVAKQQLYADAYWTFMPSHTENFGLVVLESLAQGTPVTASTGSPWKILDDQKVGFWLDNSPESIAGSLDKMMQMPPDEYSGYRERGRKVVESNYDVAKLIDRWHELYSKVAAGMLPNDLPPTKQLPPN